MYYDEKDTKRYEFISSKLEAFDGGMIQDLYSLILHMRSEDISIKEFEGWIEFYRSGRVNLGKWPGNKYVGNNESGFICPDCGLNLILMPINETTCTNIGGDDRTLFYCEDTLGCGYEQYSNKKSSYWNTLLYKVGQQRVADKMNLKPKSKGCGRKF